MSNEASSEPVDFDVLRENQRQRKMLAWLAGGFVGMIVLGVIFVFVFFPWILEARLNASAANLKQIGLGLHNYHDTFGAFPWAYRLEADGTPVHSWRVALLPHIGEEELYKEYDQNKPWDHSDNLKLLERMPQAYASPFAKSAAARGETPYMAIAGEDTALKTSDRPSRFRDLYKGLIHVATHIENQVHTVPWTKPEDVSPEWIVANHEKLKQNIYGGYLVLTADAAIRFAPADLPPEELEKTLYLSGHEGLELPILETETESEKPKVWSYGSR
ncbi:MAG: DUF1559 domain-containing protein [Pirellulaceae bacterium]